MQEVKDYLKLLLKNQKHIMKNQNNVMLAISEISVKLDNVVNKRLSIDNSFTEQSQSHSAFSFKPIENMSEILKLERSLEDDSIVQELKLKFSVVCGPGKAGNCAYKLVDFFFSRDFLAQCSWSGGARNNGQKFCFKTCKNILNLFFELVHECDNRYTMEDNERFFKLILRNANKRKLAKLQRASTVKCRAKRQKHGKAEEKESDTSS